MANCFNNRARLETLVVYKECLRNHASDLRRHVLDGCGLFQASGSDGTPAAMVCAACRCHRNFHRQVEKVVRPQPPRRHQFTGLPPWFRQAKAGDNNVPHPQACQQQPIRGRAPPSAAVPAAPVPDISDLRSTVRGLLLISRIRSLNARPVQGISGRQGMETGTRLTREKSEMLRIIAERNNWKMFREYSKDEVTLICSRLGIKRRCLKDWIFRHRLQRAANQAAVNRN